MRLCALLVGLAFKLLPLTAAGIIMPGFLSLLRMTFDLPSKGLKLDSYACKERLKQTLPSWLAGIRAMESPAERELVSAPR